MTDNQAAYQTLRLLAQKSLQAAQQLPAQVDVAEQWSGVGFSLLGMHFVLAMEELNEMLEVPTYTKLPGVQSWVRGVANVRGRLLPVFDLAAYFGGRLLSAKKQQRLLVLDRQQIYAGLWVDQVFGMQYFPATARTQSLPEALPESMSEFIEGGFKADDERFWYVFHPLKLLEQPRFLDVAVS